MLQTFTQNDLFSNNKPVFQQYLPIISKLSNETPEVFEWDIPYTIKNLSYLVHSHYRYYGKFPSVIAGQIIESVECPSPDHYVFDNFCGSGTTLVEAKLRGIASYGLDISWLSVLATNVKSSHVDTSLIRMKMNDIAAWFDREKENFSAPDDNFSSKWFMPNVARDLSALQHFILNIENQPIRDFITVAYLGIVRRVSRAYDGEVRPHINKEKRQREVISAFSKKILDMCQDHDDFMVITSDTTRATSIIGNNVSLPPIFDDGKCYLAISHPPYLNSFNYTPVFSLEFYWGKPFEPLHTKNDIGLYKQEMRAHPANEKLTEEYFNHLRKCYTETFRIQDDGAYLAIVLGDCTRNGKLIPVLDETISIVEKIGYKLHQINYRTTHYGLGKYAYNHRADYHGDTAKKKDGILIFKK